MLDKSMCKFFTTTTKAQKKRGSCSFCLKVAQPEHLTLHSSAHLMQGRYERGKEVALIPQMPSCRDGSAVLIWTTWLVSVGKLRPKL